MTNKTLPYGFKDFTGQVWCDRWVDTYNNYLKLGDIEAASNLFHGIIGDASIYIN